MLFEAEETARPRGRLPRTLVRNPPEHREGAAGRSPIKLHVRQRIRPFVCDLPEEELEEYERWLAAAQARVRRSEALAVPRFSARALVSVVAEEVPA